MKQEITISEIERLEQLSALKFSMEEKKNLIKEVNDIIKMLNKCDKVNTDIITQDNTILLDDLREDEAGPSLSNAQALMNAPKQRKGHFNVPKVVE